MPIHVAIANRQRGVSINRRSIVRAVRQALDGEGIRDAMVSVAVVGDAEISALHGRYLGDPSPTDVLSFALHAPGEPLDGQIVVSAETAVSAARRLGVDHEEELLRYVVHGTLHLAGHDDATAAGRARMRRLERTYLARLRSPRRAAARRSARPSSRRTP